MISARIASRIRKNEKTSRSGLARRITAFAAKVFSDVKFFSASRRFFDVEEKETTHRTPSVSLPESALRITAVDRRRGNAGSGADVDVKEEDESRLLPAATATLPKPMLTGAAADVADSGAAAGDDDDESLGALTAASDGGSGGTWARRAMQRERRREKMRSEEAREVRGLQA